MMEWCVEHHLRHLQGGASAIITQHWNVHLTCGCTHRVGAGCGWACCLNIMLLMYPVPRSSFLHWLSGTSFPTLIKYHRYMPQLPSPSMPHRACLTFRSIAHAHGPGWCYQGVGSTMPRLLRL